MLDSDFVANTQKCNRGGGEFVYPLLLVMDVLVIEKVAKLFNMIYLDLFHMSAFTIDKGKGRKATGRLRVAKRY